MVLVLQVASTTHSQIYKQQVKATKNNTPHKTKHRSKRELAITVTISQETSKTELPLESVATEKFTL